MFLKSFTKFFVNPYECYDDHCWSKHIGGDQHMWTVLVCGRVLFISIFKG
jgi:hypothetical protein